MKRIYMLILSCTLTVVSCDDNLDEIIPEQSLSEELAFANYNNANGVLIGTYDLMQDLHVFGSQPQFISDFITDNVNFTGSFPSLQDFNNYSINSSNSTVDEVWRDAYEVILGTNAIIANAPLIEDASDEQKLALEGEARFVRAMTYFLIANLYSQPYVVSQGSNLSVPLYLEPFTGEIINLPRNTLAEVYGQIEEDLLFAEENLPPTATQGFASSYSAAALLSRLYLYMEDWAAAAEYADIAISSPDYALSSNISFYNTISSEIIFSVENNATDPQSDSDAETSSGSWDSYYTGRDQGGRGDGEFSPDLAALFAEQPEDLRGTFTVTDVNFSGEPAVYTLKYDNGNDNSSDYAAIRVAEMMLNRAEALVELNGVDEEAIGLVNDIRSRAGLTTSWTTADFASATDLLEAIYTERRKELAFEGHRRMDLLRTGKPLRTAAPPSVAIPNAGVGVVAGDPEAIWPIPQSQININPLLEPNP
ncbi:RagB/SusD family nutrient uptake outer membrane protein [Catalinimonas niigatensis]|uniref:RagB/SusD family nutrient uptake outer membrane protein n=1 Tax=Catalinimonas niigatensis TaxID=1397264 RepID=UPI00266718B2|nr:RagB/SusD family nutrient uptake outer membrane protein [Catalinimonas niigatensis]WPP49261.1 RagB/SusD family nutrient uptake outer membrane protein [Catalinimonas niigatensis]